MTISEATKEIYKNNSEVKYLKVYFPIFDYTVPYEDVYTESFSLTESILDDESLSVVGCIASEMHISVKSTNSEIKGAQIKISVFTESTASEEIPLFDGIVDSAEKQSDKTIVDITAYDLLYSIGDLDVADWYLKQSFPLTIADIRKSLFEEINKQLTAELLPTLNQKEVTLVNDTIQIYKKYDPDELNALDVLKSICQVNGVFGIIDRDGEFTYRVYKPGDITPEVVPYTKEFSWDDYIVLWVDRVKIRENEQSKGVMYVGAGGTKNRYIVQNNMFTYNKKDTSLKTMASRILEAVGGITYTPFSAECYAMPWVECGVDTLSFTSYGYYNSTNDNPVYTTVTSAVFRREINGIQAMMDKFDATGDRTQRKFISDLGVSIRSLESGGGNSGGGSGSGNLIDFMNNITIAAGLVAVGTFQAVFNSHSVVSQRIVEAANTSYNQNYVEVSSDTAKMITTYHYDSTDFAIDTGYCKKISIDTSEYQSIDEMEVK